MTNKGWVIFATLVVLLLGGAIYLSRQNQVNVNNVNVQAIQKASADNGNIADHTEGTGTKVTLIEYGDYQCPGCDSAAPVMKQLVEKYKDKFTFVFRNKIIPGHQNSRAAASFAEAAGLQGKYFEMHDKLYDNQKTWETLPADQTRTDYFTSLITQIGGDAEKAKKDAESDDVAKKISFDDALASKSGVTGTPSFYLNGKKVDNLYALNGELSSQGAKDSAGNVAQPIWASADDFDKFALQPAFKEAGVQ